MSTRVVVAMSGGVDSAVAAGLLKKQGYEVVGMTMCFNLADSARKKPACCGTQGIEDARRVAHHLGIRHYVVNMQKFLEKYVIKDFLQEYLKGRTPNPCVRCNQFLKFSLLLKKALALDAQFLATGHYARIDPKNYLLKKARDQRKDQTYFLYRLIPGQLRQTLFPLGNYTKIQVRALARKMGLQVADKLASQEICFLPDVDYRALFKPGSRPGWIVDKQGNRLARHQGIAFYTIGQRQGLGLALGYPVYVAAIDAQNNRIVVGKREDILGTEFLVKEINFIRITQKRFAAGVKIRYNHPQAGAEVFQEGGNFRVVFKRRQFAITPGQSAVFYKGNTVLGGGIIERVLA